MTDRKPKFAVLGTGNSGQTYAADITLKGYDVNLAELPAFAENLNAIEKTGGIVLSGEAGSGFAHLNMITTDLVEAIKGVNVIIIGGSAFAHEPICKALMDRFEDGQYILFNAGRIEATGGKGWNLYSVGLATWSMLGRLWGVKTTSIDAMLTIASAILEMDCFANGLSAEDLGIRHLQPEAVCAFVE